MQNAFNKYKRYFKFIVLELVDNKKDLISREQFWIDYYDAVNKGYNICPKAGNTLGIKLSEETKRKMSLLRKGSGNGMYGKTHTKKVRKRLSEFRIGIKMSLEFRQKMKIINSGENNGMFGKNHKRRAKTIISRKVRERGGHIGSNNPNFGNKWTKEMHDKRSRAIALKGGMHGKNNPMYGNTKIKKEEWSSIVSLVKNKEVKITFLAKKYGVSIQTIYNILKGGYNAKQSN